MSDLKFVLSTVGISVFLNAISQDEKDLWGRRFNQAANAKTLSADMEEKVAELTENTIQPVFESGNIKQIRALSAELNGLYGGYDDRLAHAKNDILWLVATDTALGRKAAHIIQQFLVKQDLKSDIYVPKGLSSADPSDFSDGIKDLMNWCEKTIPMYREKNYFVVFNLTAAFKSLQGYLNIVGMFYADQINYIFETGKHLVSIPHLPIRIDTDILKEHRVELAMMAEGNHLYILDQVKGIPAGLFEIQNIEGKTIVSISAWGRLIWERAALDLLGDDLLLFPYIQYSDGFRKDFQHANAKERKAIQSTLAKVASFLEVNNGNSTALKQDGGIQYSQLNGKRTSAGKQIDHFRINLGKRVTCTLENKVLWLRRYGEHEIENNP